MLREIVIYDERVPLGIAEIFTDGRCRIRRNVLHGCGFRGRRRNHDGVFHRAVIFENLHHLRNRRPLLPDRVINANQIVTLAVDDGVERDRGLSGLPVANDQLALSAADRNHAVDGLQSGRHGLAHRLPVDDAGRQSFQGDELIGRDGAFVVDGTAERVDHAPNHGVAYGHAHDAARALHFIAFFDLGIFTEQHHAHLVFFQVHGDAGHAVREGKKFAGHHLVEAIHARDAVAERDDRAGFVHGDLRFVVLDLLADQLRNFVCLDLCHRIRFQPQFAVVSI